MGGHLAPRDTPIAALPASTSGSIQPFWVPSAITSFLYCGLPGASASESEQTQRSTQGTLGFHCLRLCLCPTRPAQGRGAHCSASTRRSRFLSSQSPSSASALSLLVPPGLFGRPLRASFPRAQPAPLPLRPLPQPCSGSDTLCRFGNGVCVEQSPALAEAAWDLGLGEENPPRAQHLA